eukprot:9114804-Pyramimonas_sp.AAC.1
MSSGNPLFRGPHFMFTIRTGHRNLVTVVTVERFLARIRRAARTGVSFVTELRGDLKREFPP